MHILSKSTFIKGSQCEKALYLYKKHPYLRDPLPPSRRAVLNRGTDVGIFAQQCFPNGVNMAPAHFSKVDAQAEKTSKNLSDTSIQTMYEATFIADDTLIMVDILTRDNDGWKAIEVKSSLALSETYYKDAALQYFVLKKSGVKITDFQLMYVNKDYVRNGKIELEKLFICESVMAFCESQYQSIEQKVKQFKEMLQKEKSPQIEVGEQCENPYHCDFFGHCHGLKRKNISVATKQSSKPLLPKLSLGSNPLYLCIYFAHPCVPAVDGDSPYHHFPAAYAVCNKDGVVKAKGHCRNDFAKRDGMLKEMVDVLRDATDIVVFSNVNISSYLMKYTSFQTNEIIYKIKDLGDIFKENNTFPSIDEKELNLHQVCQILCIDSFEHACVGLELKVENDKVTEESINSALDYLVKETAMLRCVVDKMR